MRFIKYLLLAAFTSTALSLDPNRPATYLQTVTNGAKTIQQALENYNGGFIESVKLASTIQKAHEASVATRKIMEGYERFSDADGRHTIDEYHKLHPHVIDGLRIVEEKVSTSQTISYAYG
ncbi:hypothetical protein ASPWEDRAFT_646819 [Aspergillus wentii DTO 134E9]|uniref:Uncharacterized protein n=1 Tax=Aspergillus wentii DTO 134E9 TaxID=1073089 RepID=A0A1L9RB08_ASPWE|nr:uncharacterized protein ASPWEDRAFT_646819 [Aspergillus wentii DTO 134E9]OJJ32037.1 hypothetical protein ASPWEDRAFT_646819 [Aspergillus wentii DTO 134E9]